MVALEILPDPVVMQKLASIDRCLRAIRDYLVMAGVRRK
jgi:hypothetical protein